MAHYQITPAMVDRGVKTLRGWLKSDGPARLDDDALAAAVLGIFRSVNYPYDVTVTHRPSAGPIKPPMDGS